MVAKKDEDRRSEPYCNVNCGIDQVTQKINAMHEIIIGDGKSPGLAEMVRSHNKFIENHQKWYAVIVTSLTVGAVGVTNGTNITIQNCNISYGGGRTQSGTTRFGNGIQVNDVSNNITIDDNSISQVYDSAISAELFTDAQQELHHVVVTNNTIDKCNSGIAFQVLGASGDTSGKNMHDMTARYNTITNGGLGWSGYSHNLYGSDLKSTLRYSEKDYLSDVDFSFNSCTGSAGWQIHAQEGTEGINIHNNLVQNGTGVAADAYYGAITLHGGNIANDGFNGSVYDNLIVNNARSGIYVINSKGVAKIYNNTIYDSPQSETTALGGLYFVTAQNFIAENNYIEELVGYAMIVGGSVSSYTTDYNVFYRPSSNMIRHNSTNYTTSTFDDYQSASGQDENSESSGPLLVKILQRRLTAKTF